MVRRAVAVHLLARLASVAAVVAALRLHPLGSGTLGGDLGRALGKSDGVWYLAIAHHGFGPPPPLGPNGTYTHLTSLAFFPGYPLLVHAGHLLGLPYLAAALVVTAVAGTVAAALLAVWLVPTAGPRGALTGVALWELLPSSVVLSMAYSEALFAAAATATLVALARRRWVAAAVGCTAAGLTRPTGAALLLAVWLSLAVAARRDGLRTRQVAAAVVAPLGLLAALLHVAVVTGRWDGWFWLERTAWRSGFDGGADTVGHVGQLLTGGRAAHRMPEVVACVVVLAALAGTGRLLIRRAGGRPGATAYAAAGTVLAVGQRGYFYVKPRLLLVLLPLLAPPTTAVAGWSRRRLAAAALPVTAASLAYNAYLLAGWPKAL